MLHVAFLALYLIRLKQSPIIDTAMKRKISFVFVFLLLLAAVPVTVFLVGQQQELRKKAAPATTLSLLPSQITAKAGDEFTVEVNIDTGSNQVIVIELHAVFDPTKLEAVTITNSSLAPNIIIAGVVDQSEASITVGTSDTKTPIKGTGTVASIRFKAKAKTDTPISVRLGPNTFVAALTEKSSNVLTGTTPATVTITGGTGSDTATSSADLVPSLPTSPLTSTISATPSVSPTPISTSSAQLSPPATQSATLTVIPFQNNTTTSTKPTIKGKTSPGATVTVTVYSTPVTTVVAADSQGNWSFTPATPLDSGPHNVVASVLDSSGQTITATSSFVVASGSTTQTYNQTQSVIPVSGNETPTLLLVGLGVLLLIGGALYPFILKSL